MKSKNAKSGKKSAKASRKVVTKELEASLATRFTEVVKSLGHSSDGIVREISKTSKRISKKLISGLAEALEPAREKKLPKKAKADKAAVKKAMKPVAKKEMVKAKKVVAEAGAGKKKEFGPGMSTTTSGGISGNEQGTQGQENAVKDQGVSQLSVKRLRQAKIQTNGDEEVSPS